MSAINSSGIIGDNRHALDGNELTERLRNLLDRDLSSPSGRSQSPPPPYSSGSSTRCPPLLGFRRSDSEDRREREKSLRLQQSVPAAQFKSQVKKERKRYNKEDLILGFQASRGAKLLPYDESQDQLANAENNVRARWVKQGIWKKWWGSAWPKGLMVELVPYEEILPLKNEDKCPRIAGTARWGHELEMEREDKPAPGEVNIDASRPYFQFMSQIEDEMTWLRWRSAARREAGMDNLEQPSNDDYKFRLVNEAYEAVKNHWNETQIWNPKWERYPGLTWMHADLFDAPLGHIHPPALKDLSMRNGLTQIRQRSRVVLPRTGTRSDDLADAVEGPESRPEVGSTSKLSQKSNSGSRRTIQLVTAGPSNVKDVRSQGRRNGSTSIQSKHTKASRNGVSTPAAEPRLDHHQLESSSLSNARRQPQKKESVKKELGTRATTAPRRSSRNTSHARPDYNPPVQRYVELTPRKRKRGEDESHAEPPLKRHARTARAQKAETEPEETAKVSRNRKALKANNTPRAAKVSKVSEASKVTKAPKVTKALKTTKAPNITKATNPSKALETMKAVKNSNAARGQKAKSTRKETSLPRTSRASRRRQT